MKTLSLCVAAVLNLVAISGPVASEIGGDFSLTAHTGERFHLAETRGQVVVIAFGYTSCPDVCPLVLGQLATALRGLGPDIGSVQPLFISVDPKRDSEERLAQYVTWFHPKLIGLRGSIHEIDAVARKYHVQIRRHPGVNDFYTVDHSSNLYILRPDGQLALIMPHGLPSSAIESAIQAILDGADHPRRNGGPAKVPVTGTGKPQ